MVAFAVEAYGVLRRACLDRVVFGAASFTSRGVTAHSTGVSILTAIGAFSGT